jgi:hypothetical protein
MTSAKLDLAPLISDSSSAYLKAQIEKRKGNKDSGPIHSYPSNGLPRLDAHKPLVRPAR